MDPSQGPTAVDPLFRKSEITEAHRWIDAVLRPAPATTKCDHSDADGPGIYGLHETLARREDRQYDGRFRQIGVGLLHQICWPAQCRDHPREAL